MKYTKEQYFRIWLSSVENVGAATFARLMERYGSAEKVWDSFGGEMSWIGDKAWQAMSEAHDREKATALIERIVRAGADVVFLEDAEYPRMMRELPDPPPLLYVKGRTDLSDEVCVSIVGTREPSVYGVKAAASIAEELAHCGACVISGFAKGIDSAAHEAALDAGGRTIAVFACGVDVVYPPSNGALYERLLRSGGSVVSEYPPGTAPISGRFPARNRLISGMSRGTLVCEGRWRSGAKITAGYAADQGRDVFILPGNIDQPLSELPNRLARDGARLITSAADILDDLNLVASPQAVKKKTAARRASSKASKKSSTETPAQPSLLEMPAAQSQAVREELAAPAAPELDDEQSAVLELYKTGVTSVDGLVEKTGMAASRVNMVLTMLAIEGIIQ